jgi:hypothetical protein
MHVCAHATPSFLSIIKDLEDPPRVAALKIQIGNTGGPWTWIRSKVSSESEVERATSVVINKGRAVRKNKRW